ncbi:MAG: hypothetical protein ACREU6_02150 [Steroidobacteraceae bacterium]
MSQPRSNPATEIGLNDPPAQQDPTHDVPVYPEQGPPQGPDEPIKASDEPSEGEGEGDVDDDDLEPQAPHSPPDGGKGRVIFDENEVAG